MSEEAKKTHSLQVSMDELMEAENSIDKTVFKMKSKIVMDSSNDLNCEFGGSHNNNNGLHTISLDDSNTHNPVYNTTSIYTCDDSVLIKDWTPKHSTDYRDMTYNNSTDTKQTVINDTTEPSIHSIRYGSITNEDDTLEEPIRAALVMYLTAVVSLVDWIPRIIFSFLSEFSSLDEIATGRGIAFLTISHLLLEISKSRIVIMNISSQMLGWILFIQALIYIDFVLSDYMIQLWLDCHICRGVIDNSCHVTISWFIWLTIICGYSVIHAQPYSGYYTIGKKRVKAIYWELILAAMIGSLVDVDHFIAGFIFTGEFSIHAATHLASRPFAHSVLFACVVPVIYYCVYRQQKRISCVMFTSIMSHQLRDSIRRGLWFYPLGSTPPLSLTFIMCCYCGLTVLGTIALTWSGSIVGLQQQLPHSLSNSDRITMDESRHVLLSGATNNRINTSIDVSSGSGTGNVYKHVCEKDSDDGSELV